MTDILRRLVGTSPGQVPRNKDLGSMAFQDVSNYYSHEVMNFWNFRNKVINGDFKLDPKRTNYNRYNQVVSCGSQNANWGYQTYFTDQWFVGMQYSGGTIYAQTSHSDAIYNDRTQVKNKYTDGGVESMCVIKVASAASMSNAQAEVGIGQYIEGYTLPDWHTSNRYTSKPWTISFWAKSSIAGKYAFSMYDAQTDRSMVRPYYIETPGQWYYYSFTFYPDSDIGYKQSIGLRLWWSLGVGSGMAINMVTPSTSGTSSQNLITPDADQGHWLGWHSPYSGYRRSGFTDQVNLSTTTNATFQLTGVQLERGDRPTPFEQRPYAIERTLADRYWQRYRYLAGSKILMGHATSSSSVYGRFYLRNTLREYSTPFVITYQDGSGYTVGTTTRGGVGNGTAWHNSAQGNGTGQMYWWTGGAGTPGTYGTHYLENYSSDESYTHSFGVYCGGAAGYTSGQASMLYCPNDHVIDVSARMTFGYDQ